MAKSIITIYNNHLNETSEDRGNDYETNTLKESSLSRLWKYSKDHDCGTITAWRTYNDTHPDWIKERKYTRKENQIRNNELMHKLIAKGYGVTQISGYGAEDGVVTKEMSFFVVDKDDKGTLKKDLISLGTEYDQDSITFSKASGEYYLISSNTNPNGDGGGKIGVEYKLGKPMFGKDGEFYSKIKGRPFVFEKVINKDPIKLSDFIPTELRSFKRTINKDKK